jgi:hypothetical protein
MKGKIMKNLTTRIVTTVSKLEPGQYFSLPEYPDVPMKCYEHDEEDMRIIAICCDPFYHKLAISYDDSVLLGFPE